ncbi:hypothetical protein LQZ19_02890 [Treponema primitia]|uniref:hypothetical protein n=1 Tax=Treponema primitia TaxID=88058 RepID=UPI00397F340D
MERILQTKESGEKCSKIKTMNTIWNKYNLQRITIHCQNRSFLVQNKTITSNLNTINSHLYHYAGNNPIRYTDRDGRMPALALVPFLPAIGAVIAEAAPYVIAFIAGVALGKGLQAATEHTNNDEGKADTAAANVESNAQAAAPQPENQNDNNNGGNNSKKKNQEPTKRDLNEEKRSLQENRDFREYFHREYKPSEKVPTSERHNPDMSDEQLWEAYQEWQTDN